MPEESLADKDGVLESFYGTLINQGAHLMSIKAHDPFKEESKGDIDLDAVIAKKERDSR